MYYISNFEYVAVRYSFSKYNNQTVEICYIVLTTQSEFTVCIQVQLDILIIVV